MNIAREADAKIEHLQAALAYIDDHSDTPDAIADYARAALEGK